MLNLNKNIHIAYFISSISLLSLIYALVSGENSIGGAVNDYFYHEKYLSFFSNNVYEGLQKFGSEKDIRNSPVFYILFSKILDFGISINFLKYVNALIILPLMFFFIKSIKLKYKEVSNFEIVLLLSFIFLSPTVRSLMAYPYPLLWAISFFSIAIYYYLKFSLRNNSIKNALLVVLFTAISAYFTPNFAVFYLYFSSKILTNSKKFNDKLIFLIFSILLAIPAIFFLIWKDFYIINAGADGISLTFFDKINFFNKFIIITTTIFLFAIPIINFQKLKKIYLSFKFEKNFIFIFFFFIINLFFFNFKPDIGGGGIFYQFSQILFKNNILLYIFFFLSLIFFNFYKLYNFNNIFLFVTLILYNVQYTIYYKYYDPLLIYIFLFLVKFENFYKINIKQFSINLIIFYTIFLILNLSKVNFKNFMIN